MYTTRQVTNDGIELTRAVNHLATNVVKTNGAYHFGMEWQPQSPQGQYVQTARRLWEINEAQVRREKR